MKPKTILSLSIAAGMIISLGSANAAILINEYPTGNTSNIGVTASSFINNNNHPLMTVATNYVSGADFAPGVLNDPTDGQHGNGTQQSWRATNTTAVDAASEWIQWDLGASFQLDSIRVWNYNDGSRYASGIRNLDIYLSNVASPGDPEGAGSANWTHWAVNATLLAAPGTAGYTGFDLETAVGSSLPAGEFRFVRFEVNSTFIGDGIDLGGGVLGGQNASLSQIEFYAIPEPSVALLSSLGLLALLRRRRA